MPLTLLSGVILPMSLAPAVLRTIANFNPLAYAVSAARFLFEGNLSDVTVIEGFVIMGVLAVLAVIWGVHSFRRAMV